MIRGATSHFSKIDYLYASPAAYHANTAEYARLMAPAQRRHGDRDATKHGESSALPLPEKES